MTDICAMCEQPAKAITMHRSVYGMVCAACWQKAKPETAQYWMEYEVAINTKKRKKRGTTLYLPGLLTVIGIVAIAMPVAVALAMGEYLNWEDRGYLGRDEGEQS